ncbi:hypothetical protein LWI28_023105 [Acer negundo]|uniref:Uncharacterized protein n=1 Tax=Acer negundo TaxID=4023 RepID=A0AAD5P069_ACENE|nr:hypothetical protein LWI28_023105 [Acer negundo]
MVESAAVAYGLKFAFHVEFRYVVLEPNASNIVKLLNDGSVRSADSGLIYFLSTTKGSAFPIKSAAGKLFSADISQFYMIKNSSNNTLFLFSVAALKLGAKGLLNSFSADITVLKTLTTISSHQNRITANGDSSHYDFTHCKNDIP